MSGLAVLLCVLAMACDFGGDRIELPPLELTDGDAGSRPSVFACTDVDSTACEDGVHLSCRPTFEFLEVVEEDCRAKQQVCDPERVCITCAPKRPRCKVCEDGDSDCNPQQTQVCSDDGERWIDMEVCDLEGGEICSAGKCERLCDVAAAAQSYVGCEFYAADLDNAAIDALHDASSQQYAVAVANPHPIPITVWVEINQAPYGRKPVIVEIERRKIPPGYLEVFELPRREVDGSSETGLDDGTHTAVTSNAYRIGSSHPVTAYQFNPLENVNVFSNDASLLLPISAIGDEYTVVTWPQTIGDSDNPDLDFDPTTSGEDLRSFLTVIGTQDNTRVRIELGRDVVKVVGGGPIPSSGPDQVIQLDIGPFDVINLETEATKGDFTGTFVEASKPVSVFVGSEASDVPLFGDFSTRQCCADHLEEQLFPDRSLGSSFVIAKMPSRTKALNAAERPGDPLGIAITEETERVRIVATRSGVTHVKTTLPEPDDDFELRRLQDVILKADQDFIIESDKPIAVLQALPSQDVTGIPSQYPGGDPAIVAVPPIEQYRRDYIFLTPDKYAFDFVTITASETTSIRLDGRSVPGDWGCETAEVEGFPHEGGEEVAANEDTDVEARVGHVIYRCQLSFPIVPSAPRGMTQLGDQNDGVHTLEATAPIGVVVYGFDRFVSYAYAAGLNLRPLL
ncbi:MAG: IgGFc-binding protein [Myxococcales bacterium]|nr:IgGFc-binding protein [Myxococcales bacterium]MDD9965699.1 IgGFc-binding protein [Myxococcales bacterium]